MEFMLDLRPNRLPEPKQYSTRKYPHNKINWKIFNTTILRKTDTLAIRTARDNDVEEIEKKIRMTLEEALTASKAKKKTNNKATHSNARENNKRNTSNKQVWWDTECQEARNKKKNTLKKFIRNPTPENWSSYKRNEANLSSLIKRKKEEA